MRRHLALALACCAAGLASTPARATVIAPMELGELARKADVVVRGTVRESRSEWSADGKRIVSVAKVAVTSCAKGAPGEAVEVRTPGGSVGDISQVVRGAPRLAPGEEVVLFLERVPGSRLFSVAGFALGKFEVLPRPEGEAVVTRRTPGVELLGPDGRAAPAPEFGPLPVSEFFRRVRNALEERAP